MGEKYDSDEKNTKGDCIMVDSKNHLYTPEDAARDRKNAEKRKVQQQFSRFSNAEATSVNNATIQSVSPALQRETKPQIGDPYDDTAGSVSKVAAEKTTKLKEELEQAPENSKALLQRTLEEHEKAIVEGEKKTEEGVPKCIEECVYTQIYPKLHEEVMKNMDTEFDKEFEEMYPPPKKAEVRPPPPPAR